MKSSKYRFVLDMHTAQSQISIPALLGDTDRTLYITFSDGGNPYTIEKGCTAKLSIKRPTGTFLTEFCSIADNTTIVYPFDQNENTAAVVGIHDCDVTLYNPNGRKITSPKFTMVVSETAVNSDDLNISDEDKTLVDAMISAEASRVSAENGRVKEEASRVNAEIERVEAEEQRNLRLEEAEEQREQRLDEAILRLDSAADNIDGTIKISCYDSVAKMKADAELKDGMSVMTTGYHYAGDGGGAVYSIRKKTASDVNDGGLIHVINNSLVAELIVENGIVYAKQFGIKGSEYAGKVDESDTIQRAIDYCSENGIKLIIANASIYITKTIVFHKSRLYNSSLEIEFTNANLYTDKAITMVDWSESESRPYPEGFRMIVRGLHLNGGNSALVGLRINKFQCYTLENFYIDSCSVGLEMHDVLYGTMRGHSTVNNCIVGLDFTGSENNAQVIKNLWVTDGKTRDSENSIGIRMKGLAHAMLFENINIGNYAYGIFENDPVDTGFVADFRGVYFKGISKQFMHFRGRPNINIISVENCHVSETRAELLDKGFVLKGGTFNIFNNNFRDHILYIENDDMNVLVNTDMETAINEEGTEIGWRQVVNRRSNAVNDSQDFVERNSVIVRDENHTDPLKLKPVYNYQQEDIEFPSYTGWIMNTPSGKRYKVQIDETGHLVTHLLRKDYEKSYYNTLSCKDILALCETLKSNPEAYPYTTVRCEETSVEYDVTNGKIALSNNHAYAPGLAPYGDIQYILNYVPKAQSRDKVYIYNTDLEIFYMYKNDQWVSAGKRPSASDSATWLRAVGLRTEAPLDPPEGFIYYDVTNGEYLEWTSSGWQPAVLGEKITFTLHTTNYTVAKGTTWGEFAPRYSEVTIDGGTSQILYNGKTVYVNGIELAGRNTVIEDGGVYYIIFNFKVLMDSYGNGRGGLRSKSGFTWEEFLDSAFEERMEFVIVDGFVHYNIPYFGGTLYLNESAVLPTDEIVEDAEYHAYEKMISYTLFGEQRKAPSHTTWADIVYTSYYNPTPGGREYVADGDYVRLVGGDRVRLGENLVRLTDKIVEYGVYVGEYITAYFRVNDSFTVPYGTTWEQVVNNYNCTQNGNQFIQDGDGVRVVADDPLFYNGQLVKLTDTVIEGANYYTGTTA